MTTRHDGSRWRDVRHALGLRQEELAAEFRKMGLDGMAASTISRYENGHHVPLPHIQGAYQVVAMQGGVDIPEMTGPRIQPDYFLPMLDAEQIIGYCTNVIDGVETAAPPADIARAILALARASLAAVERRAREAER